MRPQRADPIHQSRHRLRRFSKPLHMGEISACFDGNHEIVGRLLTPFRKGALFGQSVERIVDFDRGEALTVEGQPLGCAHLGRVEPRPPVCIVPARRSDEDGHIGGAVVSPARRNRSTRELVKPGLASCATGWALAHVMSSRRSTCRRATRAGLATNGAIPECLGTVIRAHPGYTEANAIPICLFLPPPGELASDPQLRAVQI